MSSFGGIPIDLENLRADVLVSSANKCLQGVPGFGFVVARRELLEASEGRAASLSLDLYDQWRGFEEGAGKWRFTSPTHVVRALVAALDELDEEGGPVARHARYRENRDTLLEEFEAAGFRPLLREALRSPIITSFLYPDIPAWSFESFYERLKERGFVLYPGKVSKARTFRVGTIGHVFPSDFRALGAALREVLAEDRA
jgi:2-aminoethylphosphonate-pyruvate transaminase